MTVGVFVGPVVTQKRKNISLLIAFCLIVISAVCFYRKETISIFIAMNGVAGIIVGAHAFIHRGLRVVLTPFLVWLTVLFTFFLIYGTLFLRAGIFNGDKFIFIYAECWLLYYIIKNFLSYTNDSELFAIGSSVCAIVCMIMLLINEGRVIFSQEGLRLGSTLVGNANSVGMSLGFMSLFITDYFGKSKKKRYLFLNLMIAVFMLATGSKKALIYLLFDLIILYSYSKDKAVAFLKLFIIMSILAYMVFCVDFFYNIIGHRIVDMIASFGFHVSGAQYSYSTSIRLIMLKEAYQYWLESPIWGSGMNYFYLRTSTGFEYSHSNIMELLCNMGLIGCLMYYFPFFISLTHYRKYKAVNVNKANFILGLSIIIFVMGFMAVGYSDTCLSYLQAIYCFAYYEICVRKA